MNGLRDMLDQNNVLVKSFCIDRDCLECVSEKFLHEQRLCRNGLNGRCAIASNNRKQIDGWQYNLPTALEVAGLIVNDFNMENFECNVIVEHNKMGLQRISELYPNFMEFSYPLLFP